MEGRTGYEAAWTNGMSPECERAASVHLAVKFVSLQENAIDKVWSSVMKYGPKHKLITSDRMVEIGPVNFLF